MKLESFKEALRALCKGEVYLQCQPKARWANTKMLRVRWVCERVARQETSRCLKKRIERCLCVECPTRAQPGHARRAPIHIPSWSRASSLLARYHVARDKWIRVSRCISIWLRYTMFTYRPSGVGGGDCGVSALAARGRAYLSRYPSSACVYRFYLRDPGCVHGSDCASGTAALPQPPRFDT